MIPFIIKIVLKTLDKGEKLVIVPLYPLRMGVDNSEIV